MKEVTLRFAEECAQLLGGSSGDSFMRKTSAEILRNICKFLWIGPDERKLLLNVVSAER